MTWFEFYGCHNYSSQRADTNLDSKFRPCWNSIALKPVANQRFGDCHRFLVACEDGYRELFEDVRQYEDVFFSITGGFHLHEVYGYDLERTTGKIGQ